MGSCLSSHNLCNKEPLVCYYCSNEIDAEIKIYCIACNIVMHTECYDANRDPDHKYTICPNCKQVGVISTNSVIS